jgi:hypothetical protein
MTEPTNPTPAAKNNTWLAEHHRKAAPYSGAELRPYEGRPGATDAYQLPSVINGVRTPRALPLCTPTNNRV